MKKGEVMHRRQFLSISTGLLASLLVIPKRVWAVVWNQAAFQSTQLDQALSALGVSNPKQTDQIIVKAPDRAENGAIVQIEVQSQLPNTQSIAILVANNPTALIGTFNFYDDADGFVITRIKMADTSDVTVVVKADGQFYQNSKNVVVLENGCG